MHQKHEPSVLRLSGLLLSAWSIHNSRWKSGPNCASWLPAVSRCGPIMRFTIYDVLWGCRIRNADTQCRDMGASHDPRWELQQRSPTLGHLVLWTHERRHGCSWSNQPRGLLVVADRELCWLPATTIDN